MMRASVLLVTGSLVTASLAGVAQPAGAHVPAAPGRGPSNSSGLLGAIALIPGTSHAIAVNNVSSQPGNLKQKAGLLRGHHWTHLKAQFGRRYGGVDAAAAGSKKTVWVAGSRQRSKGIQELPVIYRLKGKKLVREKLPALTDGATTFGTISASSASNAWAAGDSVFSSQGRVAVHWNGKHWKTVSTPEGFVAISTSGPTNTWALGVDDFSGAETAYRWDGHVWTAEGTIPAGFSLSSIATSGKKLVYAAGTGGIVKWNGKAWSPKHRVSASVTLTCLTMHGKSAWAGGRRSTARGKLAGVILHTAGGKWKSVKVSGRAGQFNSISTANGKRAIAGGSYLDSKSRGHTVAAKVTAKRAKVVNSRF